MNDSNCYFKTFTTLPTLGEMGYSISEKFNTYENPITKIKIDYDNLDLVKLDKDYQEALNKQLQEKEEKEKREIQERNKRLRNRIQKVIFNGPVTVVFWEDGTKTSVKCRDFDLPDAEKAILECMAKKFYEDTNIFQDELRKYCAGYAPKAEFVCS